jgi:hypothetical protein
VWRRGGGIERSEVCMFVRGKARGLSEGSRGSQRSKSEVEEGGGKQAGPCWGLFFGVCGGVGEVQFRCVCLARKMQGRP